MSEMPSSSDGSPVRTDLRTGHPAGIVRFEDFELDPASGRLWRDGAPVELQPQPGRLLTCLVAKPGVVVTRDELREALWGDDHHVNVDQGLNYCVRQVRQALGDSVDRPHFVETVPRKGYRFIAPVRTATPAEPFQGEEPGYRLQDLLRTLGIGVVGGLALVGLLSLLSLVVTAAGPRLELTGLAAPAGGEEAAARATEALRDALIAQSSFYRLETAGAVGAQRGAYTVEGRLTRAGERLHLSVRLSRRSDRTYLWAGLYDVDVDAVDEGTAPWARHAATAIARELRADRGWGAGLRSLFGR